MYKQQQESLQHNFKVLHTYFVENSTPIVLLLSRLNSLRVNRDNKLLLPTPESPISTTICKQHTVNFNMTWYNVIQIHTIHYNVS